MHGFASEVRGERTFPIWAVLKSLVAVCTESTREHTDVSEDTLKEERLQSFVERQELICADLQRLIKDVRHLVLYGEYNKISFLSSCHWLPSAYLEVLRRSKRAREEQGASSTSVDTDPENVL